MKSKNEMDPTVESTPLKQLQHKLNIITFISRIYYRTSVLGSISFG